MPIRPISHFTWQVLRTVKRSRKPLNGRALRLIPNRHTKDGSFLAALVEAGLLAYATGSAADPFGATYRLAEKGDHAAEYGECEYELKRPLPDAPARPVKNATAKKR